MLAPIKATVASPLLLFGIKHFSFSFVFLHFTHINSAKAISAMPKANLSHGKPNIESIYCKLSSYNNETRLPSSGLKFIISNRFIIKRN